MEILNNVDWMQAFVTAMLVFGIPVALNVLLFAGFGIFKLIFGTAKLPWSLKDAFRDYLSGRLKF